MAEATAAPKKSGAGKLILGLIVLLVVYFIYKSAGAATPKTPDDVVARMMRNMGSVETAEFAGTVSATIEGSKNPISTLNGGTAADAAKPVAFSLAFSGVSEFGNWEKPQSSIKFTLTSPEFPNNGSAEIEFRTLGADKYFKLNTVPALGKLNLSALTNMWVHLDPKVLAKPDAGTSSDVTSTTVDKDTTEKIKDIVRGAKVLQVTEDLGSEDIAGISTHRYKASVNEAEVMRAAREIAQVTKGKAMSIEEETKMIEFWTRTEITNVELWIGTNDFYLYRTSFNVDIVKTAKEPTSGKLTFDLQLRNFNKPVTVEAPTGPKSMLEFMTSFLGAMTGGAGMQFLGR